MYREVAEFLDYLKFQRNYSVKTVDSYQRDIEKFLSFLDEEGAKLNEVDIIVIRNFLTDELNSGVSKRSCKRRLSSLKHFYTFMVDEKYVDDNPFLFVQTPKTEIKYPRALYREQVRDILTANSKRTDDLMIRDQAILSMLYYTGIRASELVNLKYQSVVFSQRLITVVGKGDKERIVPYSLECSKALKRYVDYSREILL